MDGRFDPDYNKLIEVGKIMLALITVETIPLKAAPDSVIRVSNTRVTLDTIVQAFNDGATAEEIAQQYPSVPLADIYSFIAYFLRHTDEVEAYLTEQRDRAEQIRQLNETRFDPVGVRARLMARQAVDTHS
jgi:uncharacterized protein (DUF433 family)